MLTGPTSLVKDCVVQRNQRLVIDTADGVQVGGCLNGTVTDNTANDNGNDGIAVGQKSLVSHNTANEGDGIEAVCPSTVTDDQASGNADLNFNVIGAGCFDPAHRGQCTAPQRAGGTFGSCGPQP